MTIALACLLPRNRSVAGPFRPRLPPHLSRRTDLVVELLLQVNFRRGWRRQGCEYCGKNREFHGCCEIINAKFRLVWGNGRCPDSSSCQLEPAMPLAMPFFVEHSPAERGASAEELAAWLAVFSKSSTRNSYHYFPHSFSVLLKLIFTAY